MGNGVVKGYKQRDYRLPCSRGSHSNSVKNPQRVLVGGARSSMFNESSFTVRGIHGERSISRRLGNMNTFYERGTDPEDSASNLLSTDKDRLENVLLCIFAEATLKSAFFDFLSERCVENLLSFRDEVEYLKSLEFSVLESSSSSPSRRRSISGCDQSNSTGSVSIEKVSMVASPVQRIIPCLGPPLPDKELVQISTTIYSRYINASSEKRIEIDYATREVVNQTLKITSSGRIAERNPYLIRNAFDEAVSKVFHVLIYDHLAHFLMSEYYRSANKPIEPVMLDQANESEGNHEEVFHTILAHPVCTHYFKNYLRNLRDTNPHRRFPVLEQVECLYEMIDYSTSADPTHRAKRCALIIKRYGRMAYGVEELIVMRNELVSYGDKIPEKYANPDPEIFNLVYYRLSNALLAEHLTGFLSSTYYDDLEDYTSKQDVFSALDRFKDGHLGTKLLEVSGTPDFGLDELALYDAALEDPLGSSMFKRFVTAHLQEENIDFYLEVKYFKEENYSTPPTGSAIYYDEFTSVEEMRFMRAMKICEKYVEVGARMQINLSTLMRERILRALASSSTDNKKKPVPLDVFDAAQQEVKKLMKLNLWSKFRQTESYQLFVSKFREKRYTNYRATALEKMEGGEGVAKYDETAIRSKRRATKIEGIKRMASIGKVQYETQPSARLYESQPSTRSGKENASNTTPNNSSREGARTYSQSIHSQSNRSQSSQNYSNKSKSVIVRRESGRISRNQSKSKSQRSEKISHSGSERKENLEAKKGVSKGANVHDGAEGHHVIRLISAHVDTMNELLDEEA